MRHPMKIVKIIGLLLLFLLFLMSITMTVQAADPITLLNIQKQEKPDYTRIILKFSATPKFSSENSGERVDLLLSNVQLSPELHNLPEGEKIVDILLSEQPQGLLVSILLRRPPRKVIAKLREGASSIIVDMFWDIDASTRPAVAFKIADMPPRKAGRRAARFQQQSPWNGHWDKFFVSTVPTGS